MRTLPSCGFAQCKVHKYHADFRDRLINRIFAQFIEMRMEPEEMVTLLGLHERVRTNG